MAYSPSIPTRSAATLRSKGDIDSAASRISLGWCCSSHSDAASSRCTASSYSATSAISSAAEISGSAAPGRASSSHKAKGLEWAAVFVSSLTLPLVPDREAQGLAGPAHLFSAARYECSDADERRLFYVAMTKARDLGRRRSGPATGMVGCETVL
jgi:hypothetical protein